MPVSGNEEMGVKSSVGQFSDYSAGIPIKKRRFPLIWPPSQSTENLPSLPTESESEQKGLSSPRLSSAISNDSIVATSSNTSGIETSLHTSGVAASVNTASLAASSNASCVAASSTAISVTAGSDASSAVETSNAATVAASFPNVTSIAASFSSFSDASEKSVPEKEKRSSDDTNGSIVQGKSNLLRVKLEEQSIASSSLADIDRKGKLVATGESDNILKKLAKSELDLVGDDSFTLNIGEDKYRQQNVDVKRRSEVPTVCGNPGLSLGLRDCLPAMASGKKKHGCLNQEKEEPLSLNLSLSKGEFDTQLGSNYVKPYANGADMLADRSNWDLNTTMDVWEGPAKNNVATERTTCMDDIKPLITSSGMPTKQQTLEEIQCSGSAKIAIPSTLSSQRYKTEDLLCVGLTTPYLHLNSNEKPFGSPAKSDLHKVVANVSSPGESVPVSGPTAVNLKPVKPEPLDESVKTISAAVKTKPMGLLNATQVKCESVERCSSECSKSTTLSTLNLVDARLVKPEPVQEAKQETSKNMEGSLNQSDDQMQHSLDTRSTTVTTSTHLSLHGDASAQVEHFIQANETEPSGKGQSASKMISSAGHDVNESNISVEIDNYTSQNDSYKMKPTDVGIANSRGTVEGSVSDEEKINLSGDILEEDSYGSDYESDGNRELAAARNAEHAGRAEDDFEDGEVREQVENTEIEAPRSEGCEARNGNDGDTGYRNLDFGVLVGDSNPSSSSVKEKETQMEHPGKISSNNTDECIDTSVNKDSNTEADKEAYLQESLTVEIASSQTGRKSPIKTMPRKPIDASENKEAVKEKEREQKSIPDSDASEGTSVTIAQGADDAQITDSEGKNNLVLPKAETSLNGDDAGMDVNNGGSKSRIINLPRASNLSSPSRTRSISGRTLQSQIGRERLPDVALEEDKFHPRGRDEAYGDVSYRFSRVRHRDQPSRNNRISFMRGRGRISSRVDTLCGVWDSQHNFASELCNGPSEFRVVRHKYASTVSDADLDFSSCNNGQDGAFFGAGRGGRKILSDDSSIFPHLPPRRRSPGGRDGPAARGLPMVRRVPRNLSPSGCIGEDGSELVGLRHMRGFANDRTNPMFARSQLSFEGLDGPFSRGNREFSSVQRRGLPRIRSKSPTRPRTRSPGPWHSPRRRSPDGFGGPLDLPHRRSPPIYRMERVRSPDRPCFAGDMVLRRHASPPYFSRPSNDLRDLDPGRDHGHPRSGIPNRSPSGRILLRNNRRLDIIDPRERNDGDDYFGGALPSGRFHELGTDGNADDRRRYGDRRGPVRPFRPPYSGADAENFHLNAEGGPRSFRFCAEDNPELHERGNMREREFDRRIKNRPGNAPRRTRNIEQEGNFRHGGEVWHDDGFDDTSRVKRKRF